MWIGVTKRFSEFHRNLLLTQDQHDDGLTKHRGVRGVLNRHYHGVSSETANSFLVGSWAKHTRVRPPRDVDVYFELPQTVYSRYEDVRGNKQSALLQEVRNVLRATYPSTDIRGDGQVVMVAFNTISVEVAPVFRLVSGKYFFCDTHDGGSYKVADPEAEKRSIESIDANNNGNLRRLIRMVKTWQSHCSVPLKSFYIELVMSEFIQASEWRRNSYYYYDWLLRDFFDYLLSRRNGYLIVPGTHDVINLGSDWVSRCETAHARAVRACEHEYFDNIDSAGEEWQKIFGAKIPKYL